MAEKEIKLNAPLTKNIAAALKAGDSVLLSGVIYTMRDKTHKLITDLIKEGKQLPFNLDGAVIYYCGATATRPSEMFGSCGPTSSVRMDAYTPLLLENGMTGMIGKGDRTPEVCGAIKKHGAVYFAAIGGAAVFYKQFIKSAEIIAYPQLLSEAVYKLTVKNFPLIVAVDSFGKSIFTENI